MQVRGLRYFLIGLGLLCLFPLVILLLTFFPPFLDWMLSFATGMDSVRSLRATCVLSLFLWLGFWTFRERLDSSVQRLLADVARVNSLATSSDSYLVTGRLSWLLLLIVFAIGAIAVGLSLLDIDEYRRLIAEDGLVEYSSAVFWLLASLMLTASLFAGKRLRRTGTVLYVILILFFIVCGGEEISWGQRLFSFAPSHFIESINKQNEANLHNIGSISVYANAFLSLTVIFFIGIPYVLRQSPPARNYLRHLDAPILHPSIVRIFLISLAVWIIIGVRFGTLGFWPISLWGHYNQMDDEIFELLAAYSFFSFSALDLAHSLSKRKSGVVSP